MTSTKEQEIFDVIIVGGGISGLTAAQELAEKKIKVCILEASPFIGGKAISSFAHPFSAPNLSKDQITSLSHPPEKNNLISQALPIEHGFRVYPENYVNLLSIMKRITTPSGSSVNTCLTNVLKLAKYQQDIPRNERLKDQLICYLEAILFGLALYMPYILCNQRADKYDDLSISELFRFDMRSPEMKSLIFCLTDSLSSGMLDHVSSLAVSNVLLNFYYAPQRTGFRTFDRPTHLAWLQPWESYLEKLNVTIHKNIQVKNFVLQKENCRDKMPCIEKIVAIENDEEKIFYAKYVISALPVNNLISIIEKNYELIRYDSRLINLNKIATLPATGVQLYYQKPIKTIEQQLFAGSMIDHPWGLSYVDQTGYWSQPNIYAASYGVISIYVAIINQSGRYIKKTLQECTQNEIAYELFNEVENEFKKRNISIPERIGYFCHSYSTKKDSLNSNLNKNDPENTKFHWYKNIAEDKLHLCITGMRKWRPLPDTLYLNNLILCGSYTHTDNYHVSTMESACESGRRAANVILKQFGCDPLKIEKIQAPKHIHLLRKIDQWLYRFWLPNPIEWILKLLRLVLDTRHIHMHHKIRSYEDLHW